MQTHVQLYQDSIRADAFPELGPLSLERYRGNEPYGKALHREALSAIEAIEKGQVGAYWAALERHQALLFELHKTLAAEIYVNAISTPEEAFDFIWLFGWRRFRFGSKVLHIKLAGPNGSALLSVLPNYRRESLEKLASFLHCEENQIVLDAVEMETLLKKGTRKEAIQVLLDKMKSKELQRHLLSSKEIGPTYMKIPLKKSNSATHVTDWTLPLRS